MTRVHVPFEVQSCHVQDGRLRLVATPWTIMPTRWTAEQHACIQQLLDARIGAVAHLEITDDGIAILSVEAAEAEPVVNCVVRGVA